MTLSFACVAMGYNISCFLCLVTSELCLLLWTFVSVLMTREFPSQSQPPGTMAVLKVVAGMLYPPAMVVLESIQQVVFLVGLVCEDSCVAVFSLVSATALLGLLTTA